VQAAHLFLAGDIARTERRLAVAVRLLDESYDLPLVRNDVYEKRC